MIESESVNNRIIDDRQPAAPDYDVEGLRVYRVCGARVNCDAVRLNSRVRRLFESLPATCDHNRMRPS